MSKILIDRQVVEQVLEALELYVPKEDYENKPVGNVMDALKAALAEHQESWEHLMRYGYAPGNYMSRCHNCDKIAYHVDKRAITCRPCAEVRHAESQKTEPVQEPKPVAYIDALKDAFFAGFTSVATYNDMLLNSPEEAWEKYKPPRITPLQPVGPVAWRYWKDKFACWEYSDTPLEFPAVLGISKMYPLYAAPPQTAEPQEPVEGTDDKAASIRWQLCLLAQTEEFSEDVRNQIGRGVWLIDRLSAKLQEPVEGTDDKDPQGSSTVG